MMKKVTVSRRARVGRQSPRNPTHRSGSPSPMIPSPRAEPEQSLSGRRPPPTRASRGCGGSLAGQLAAAGTIGTKNTLAALFMDAQLACELVRCAWASGELAFLPKEQSLWPWVFFCYLVLHVKLASSRYLFLQAMIVMTGVKMCDGRRWQSNWKLRGWPYNKTSCIRVHYAGKKMRRRI